MLQRLSIFALTLAMSTAHAESRHLSLGPHEHGTGQLNIVLEGSNLMLELLAPASDIVGFEHMPVTVKERMAVRRVAAELAKAERQFVLPAAADCQLSATQVDGEQLEAIGHTHEHDHDHRHAAPLQGPHAHAEYHAVYRYTCRQPQALDQVEVKLFAHYRKLIRLRWQTLWPEGTMRSGALTPATAQLALH